jgi:mono/diheme cytochrome c family protein
MAPRVVRERERAIRGGAAGHPGRRTRAPRRAAGLALVLCLGFLSLAEAQDGKRVFEHHCAVCHGVSGDGNGEAVPRLTIKPADLTVGRFKFRSTPSGAVPTDDDLLRTLVHGIRDTSMIPQTHVPQAGLRAVIAYIKTLSPRFAEPARAPVPIPPAPAATPDLVARGAKLYKDSGCPECHGEGGRGDGPSARKGMKDARELPIVPTDLTRRPFKRGSDVRETWKTVAVGLDGTPMPSYIDSLEPDQIWAIVLFLESLVTPERRLPEERLLPGEEMLGAEIEQPHRH